MANEKFDQLHTAYIALGSNLGDKEANLRQALKLLTEQGITIKRVSKFFVTEPYGVIDQPSFLNGACCIETALPPLNLLETLLAVENKMGRVRLRHWGERNIDLDLLLYENVIMDTEKLRLPHPDMQNRDFVLLPLEEIAPELEHPVLHKTIAKLKDELVQGR
nr:2-amino-4-hydroxy-6-hydroxymethyldihydropteridine diphosphokinase [uncultured Phascolarctobacterium sp.]